MKGLLTLLLLMPGVFAAAGMQDNGTPPAAKPEMQMMMMMKDCPMALPGIDVALSDTADGIVVDLTTTTGDVLELRRRVEHMVAMHSGPAAREGMMKNKMAGTAKYQAIERGARLTLSFKDPENVAELRSQVRTHVEQMKTGGCPMMKEMMPGMMGNRKTPSAEPQDEPKAPAPDHNSHH
jgi:hypothetical protein